RWRDPGPSSNALAGRCWIPTLRRRARSTAADLALDHGTGGAEMPRPWHRRSLVLVLVLVLVRSRRRRGIGGAR
ncbi:MAG: hypothetical protein ACK5YO_19575, partial [Planctomyces sp.]